MYREQIIALMSIETNSFSIREKNTEHRNTERKKELLPFETAWMDMESIVLSEISLVVRDKHHMISPISRT